MIHEIAKELEDALHTKGCPLKVYDGPEPTKTTTWARQRIVIEHDVELGDSFATTKTQSRNPDTRRLAICGYKLTITIQSTRTGALGFEHRRLAERVRDMILVALELVARQRKNTFLPVHGTFVTPEDLEGSETPAGAVYELRFTFDRAVNDLTWEGDKQPEFTIGDGKMTSHTEVRLDGAAEDDPTNATACGA